MQSQVRKTSEDGLQFWCRAHIFTLLQICRLTERNPIKPSKPSVGNRPILGVAASAPRLGTLQTCNVPIPKPLACSILASMLCLQLCTGQCIRLFFMRPNLSCGVYFLPIFADWRGGVKRTRWPIKFGRRVLQGCRQTRFCERLAQSYKKWGQTAYARLGPPTPVVCRASRPESLSLNI